jgi:hypothetical protein
VPHPWNLPRKQIRVVSGWPGIMRYCGELLVHVPQRLIDHDLLVGACWHELLDFRRIKVTRFRVQRVGFELPQ